MSRSLYYFNLKWFGIWQHNTTGIEPYLLLLLLILESTQTEHFTPNCGALFRMSGRYLKKHYCPMYMAKKFEL